MEPLRRGMALIPRAEALFMNTVTRMFSERLSCEEVGNQYTEYSVVNNQQGVVLGTDE
jgi:hypothetical protein